MKGEMVVLGLIVLFRTVWCLGIFFGTGYVVFWLNHSGWWFVPAVLLIAVAGSGEITIKRGGALK